MIITLHLLLSILLFYAVNWIGRHSYPIGYTKLSLHPQSNTSLAFNFMLKVFGPVVYLIIVSSFLYKLELDQFVKNIYVVSIYYALLRLAVIILTNKTHFVSWPRYLVHQSTLIIFSYLSYKFLIAEKQNIIPNLASFANELWIIILVFLYQILNKIEFSNESSRRKKESYIRAKYHDFNERYGVKIRSVLKNQKLEALTFAIMIFEDFNRPKVVRLLEVISFYFNLKRKPHTLGVMQYRTSSYINDQESVSLALKKIQQDCLELSRDGDDNNKYEWVFVRKIIERYNGGSLYSSEVSDLYDTLVNLYYKTTQDVILKTSSTPVIGSAYSHGGVHS